jgi:AAA15 family ATPase/GTPase
MLMQFKVENFLSFKEAATLSMIASKKKSRDRTLDDAATFMAAGGIRLLKCAAIYGANASGKSNLFVALKFMKGFVLNSSKESQADEPIHTSPFKLAIGYENKPSHFEIIFAANEVVYQYEFSADKSVIHSESLFMMKDGKETRLFQRLNGKITCGKAFDEGKLLENKTRSTALFLSVCANFDGAISKTVLKWFRGLKIVSGIEDESLMQFTRQCLENEKRYKVAALLKGFDLGINGIALGGAIDAATSQSSVPTEFKELIGAVEKLGKEKGGKPQQHVNTLHKIFDEQGEVKGEASFDLHRDESQGSIKLVAMSGPIIDTLENAFILAIDEFDARLHPIISKAIIQLFNADTINNRNAQLIVATHDTNLLDKDLLRRDQIWFVEKDPFGASHLTSLVEYRVRNDASFEKDYIFGKYGAVPMLENIERVFGKKRTTENRAKSDTDSSDLP